MYEHLHRRIRGAANRLARSEAGSKLYLDALRQGPRVAIGETFSNPDLAATLEHLADKVRA
jgi:gamma-glutamyltranspeptidase